MKAKRKFKEEDKIKCLLWCDRHCCLCRKNCGLDIELAHINRKLPNDKVNNIDNAIPLCYECHAEIGHYNDEEPRGNKYKPSELKSRREQVYEEFTRHLIPLIEFQVTQRTLDGGLRKFPNVGFEIRHLESRLPVKVLALVNLKNGKKTNNPGGHYAKEQPWKMNPGFRIQGHFNVPQDLLKNGGRVSATVNVEIVDEYECRHPLLPMEWVYEIDQPEKGWWYNP